MVAVHCAFSVAISNLQMFSTYDSTKRHKHDNETFRNQEMLT